MHKREMSRANDGEASSSSPKTKKRKTSDFAVQPYITAERKSPSLQELIFTKLEQEQIKPSDFSSAKLEQFVDQDPVKDWLERKSGQSWLVRNFHQLPDNVAYLLLQRYRKEPLVGESCRNHYHDLVGNRPGAQWHEQHLAFFESENGQTYLEHHLHDWVNTEQGAAWFEQHPAFLESQTGQEYLKEHLHDWVNTEQGAAWFEQHPAFLESQTGQEYLKEHLHDWVNTEQGAAFLEQGDAWFEQHLAFLAYLKEHLHDWVNTEQGAAWYEQHPEFLEQVMHGLTTSCIPCVPKIASA